MAEEKKGTAPSFTRLIRGGSQQPSPSSTATQAPTKSPSLQMPSLGGKEDEKRRKPIMLSFPKAGEAAEKALFSIGYKEWGFLAGAVGLLFGGMGLVRVFSPKEAPVTPAFDVPPTDFDEASRPPDGSELSEEVVSSAMKARDTTRLVQAPSDMMAKAALDKKDKSPKDQLKESFWSGMKEAEKGAVKPPRIPGMFGALNSLMGGGGSGGQPPSRIMSPDEISSRISGIPRGPGRGTSGGRLGYTGGQQIPSFGGQKRLREESSKDAYRNARQKGADSMGKFSGQPEKQAAEAASKFGEGTGGSDANQGPEGGAAMGGSTPQQDNGQAANVSYKIGRDPIADMVAQEWIKENMRREAAIWDNTYGKVWELAGTAIAKTGEGIFGAIWGKCKNASYQTTINSLSVGDFFASPDAGTCGALIGNFEGDVGVVRKEQLGANQCRITLSGTMVESGSSSGKEKTETETKRYGTDSCDVNLACKDVVEGTRAVGGGGSGLFAPVLEGCMKEREPKADSAVETAPSAPATPVDENDNSGDEVDEGGL